MLHSRTTTIIDRSKWSMPLRLAVLTLLLGVGSAHAQNFVEYSAKFMCGVATTATVDVQPGTYSTTINIHNPHDNLFSSQPATTFLKKAVQALQEGVTEQPPSAFVQDTLNNDFAEEVDCVVIRRLLKVTSTAFIEGYVVIIVPPTTNTAGQVFTNQLDVVGVYTSTAAAGGAVTLALKPANEHIIAPGTT